MSDMSDDDSVEFLGSSTSNGGGYSPAPPPAKPEKKRAKAKLKTDSGKAKPAKVKSSKESKKVTAASSSSTTITEKKTTKSVKPKLTTKSKSSSTTASTSATATASSTGKEKKSASTTTAKPKKKKKLTTSAASTSVAPAGHASAYAAPSKPRPSGMLSVLDLCSNEDDAETEDEAPRLQHYQQRPPQATFGGPHYSVPGAYDDGMSSVDEDSASVVDSESGSIKTPPKKRVKKKAPAAKVNRDVDADGDALLDEDDDGEGTDEGWSDHNRWYCNICKDGGELLCCDRCPRAFHMSCLGMKGKAIPDTEWYCKMCTECLDRRRLKKETREKARLMREAAKLERDADKRKMKQIKEDIIAQKNADAIETKAKRVLEMQDRILSRKKIKYKDKEEEKLGKLAEDLAQTVRAAKEKLEKLEKEDAALKKKEEAFNKKKKVGADESAAEGDDAAATKSDKPVPTPWVLGEFPMEHTGDLLAVWDSLNSFSSVVSLTPFTSEQLAAALMHRERSPLATEIHMCLLSLVLEDREEEDYVSDDEASMDEAERFRYEIQHAPTTIGVPTSNLLNSVSWPAILYNLTMAVPRYSASLSSVLKAALDAVSTKEYPELSLSHKLALLKFLISRAYATEKFRQMLGKHVTEGVNATKEFNRAALQDRKIAVEEEKKLREKQRVELADLAEKGKASVKTWLKTEKKTVNGVIVDTASVEGEDSEMKSDVGVGSASDSELDDLTEEALAKNEEDLEKLLADGYISRHEYLSRKKQLEHQREKLRKRAEEVLKKQKALELLERKRTAAKKAIQEGLVAKDPDSLKIAIEKAKECELPERIIVSASHVLEILEAEAVREEEAEARKNKFNKMMRELYVRTEPLGRDKAGMRYWIFRGDKSHLYVEQPSTFDLKKHYSGVDTSEKVLSSAWSFYGSQAEVTALIQSLDERNQYEGPLRNALKENFDRLSDDMPVSKPGLLLSDLHHDNDAKKRAKSRPANGNADDETADFLAWRNDKKTWKKKNHLKSDVEAFREDLVDIEVWMSKRLKELGSGWHDAGRNEWVKNVKTMATVTEAVTLVLALENEVTSFQLRAQGLLAGSNPAERNGKTPAASNGDANVSNGNGTAKDGEKSEEEDDDEDDDLDEEEAAPDDGTILWPTPKSRDRWVAEVKKAKTFATLSAALGSFVQRLEIFGFSELAMDDTAVTTRRAKSEKEKQARKERAVKKKQKVEAEEAEDVEVEHRHSVDDWEEDCYICTEGGELLCCDGCPRVFHYPCVGLRRVPRGKTFCHHCDPSVKPVYPVVNGRTTVRAKAEPEVVAESVEESSAEESDEEDSDDAELRIDPGSLNAAVKHPEDQWDVECGVCRLGGELLCCDGCPRAFHTKCIDLEDVPEDEWFCDECNLQTCGSCKKNKIRLDSHVICGSEDGTKGCEKVFHLKCAKLSAVPEDDWYCNKCRKTLK